jgi:HK97 family phage portal protein
MGIFDVFRKKTSAKEANTLFGQTALGNQITYGATKQGSVVNSQLLYVTTSSVNDAGRTVDVSMLSRNSTVMSCIGAKARSIAQLPMRVMCRTEDGKYVDAIEGEGVTERNKAKAIQVMNLIQNPNAFQSQYEFWYQWLMWHELSGESFTLWWRKDQGNPSQTPIEMYILDSTLIAVQVTPTRYPSYRLSTPSYGFSKDDPLASHQVMHIKDMAWQGSAGFNKGILATELVSLDQDIDLYANYVMLNGAKPSGMFVTESVIPDGKYKEIAARLKEAWANMTGSQRTDGSKPGQGMLLDQGMKYMPLEMLTLQDADARELKLQTMKRICGIFGVPPSMIGIGESKYNNTQTMLDEYYKSAIYPIIVNIQQKLKQHLLSQYPSLCIEFDTRNFLKGAPLDQMNFAKAGVTGGILTPNEAREYLGMSNIEGGDELVQDKKDETIPGSSPQDTGGGGGNQRSRMNIGSTEQVIALQPEFNMTPNITVKSEPMEIKMNLKQEDKPSKPKTIKLIRNEDGVVVGAETFEHD